MKLTTVCAALVGFATFVTSQDLSGLPDCAEKCAGPSIPTDCGIDIGCICSESSFMEYIACCVYKECEPDDQERALVIANGLCRGNGVTDIPQSAYCASDFETATPTTAEETEASATETGSATDSAELTASGSASESASETASETEATSGTGEPEPTGSSAAVAMGVNGGAMAAFVAALAVFA